MPAKRKASRPPETKRKRVKKPDPNVIQFKASTRNAWRQLSNLFGGVEFEFQAAKYKPESEVYQYLMAMKTTQWDLASFTEEFNAMHDNNVILDRHSRNAWVDAATGILAQFCSGIAHKNTPVFVRRLNHIRDWCAQNGTPPPPLRSPLPAKLGKNDMAAWQAAYAHPYPSDEAEQEKLMTQKDALLETLVRAKCQHEPYRTVLLNTGTKMLGEAPRGKGNRYTFNQQNVVGKILMKVRAELRA